MPQVILLLPPQNLPSLRGRPSILVSTSFLFVSIALETLGLITPCSLDFLTDVGWQLSAATGAVRETAFLFQRISVARQRFNAVLSLLSYPTSSRTSSHSNMCLLLLF